MSLNKLLQHHKNKMELQWDLKNIRPHTFDSEKEEDVEAFLLNTTKYFQVYENDNNLKERLEIYQLQGKFSLWWEEAKKNA